MNSENSDQDPTLPECAAYGIIDPDYARVFTVARKLAWEEGYALMMHGSFTRDLDLIAVPWGDRVCEPGHLVKRILASNLNLRLHPSGDTGKLHGRVAWTFLFPDFGDPRFVDFSVFPTSPGSFREELAAYAHAAWSGWMEYLFSKCSENDDGSVTMPKWAVDRWRRQTATSYADLPKAEQNSDRLEADEILSVLRGIPACVGCGKSGGVLVYSSDQPTFCPDCCEEHNFQHEPGIGSCCTICGAHEFDDEP